MNNDDVEVNDTKYHLECYFILEHSENEVPWSLSFSMGIVLNILSLYLNMEIKVPRSLWFW
jgi:hypothetical protein